MAHYAFLNNNLVTEVIVGNDESTGDWETYYAEKRGLVCKRTSYNTHAGVHNKGGTPFRKNYAGIGFTYDPVRDAFIPPSPPGSDWEIDDATGTRIPPDPYPAGGVKCIWNENLRAWVEFL